MNENENLNNFPKVILDIDDVLRILMSLAQACIFAKKNNKKEEFNEFIKTYYKIKNNFEIEDNFEWELFFMDEYTALV